MSDTRRGLVLSQLNPGLFLEISLTRTSKGCERSGRRRRQQQEHLYLHAVIAEVAIVDHLIRAGEGGKDCLLLLRRDVHLVLHRRAQRSQELRASDGAMTQPVVGLEERIEPDLKKPSAQEEPPTPITPAVHSTNFPFPPPF